MLFVGVGMGLGLWIVGVLVVWVIGLVVGFVEFVFYVGIILVGILVIVFVFG